jgi:hypothetical protein
LGRIWGVFLFKKKAINLYFTTILFFWGVWGVKTSKIKGGVVFLNIGVLVVLAHYS